LYIYPQHPVTGDCLKLPLHLRHSETLLACFVTEDGL
jgi:hypothetical protein